MDAEKRRQIEVERAIRATRYQLERTLDRVELAIRNRPTPGAGEVPPEEAALMGTVWRAWEEYCAAITAPALVAPVSMTREDQRYVQGR